MSAFLGDAIPKLLKKRQIKPFLLGKIIGATHLDQIDFRLADNEADTWGTPPGGRR
ncbi:hypothetical protein [Cerasicoccus maritimus]|uniref:hypothetical protein n=1 Tax=Cerasicoccus maritimus TaxID=490089 RepID=UPI002852D3CC|nr:hypothetical protein [Cerasicoccus maritimus]